MDYDGILYCTLLTILVLTLQLMSHKGKRYGLGWNTLLHFINNSFDDPTVSESHRGKMWIVMEYFTALY